MSVDSSVIVRPARAVQGLVRIPGDKSISHRYAMLAAIARGTSRFHNFSGARDCASTLGCVAALDAQFRHAADGAVEVTGLGPALHAPSGALDCGNSGSTMRMLSGILAGQPFTSELFGDESLSRRPMARIIKPLSEMGTTITCSAAGRPPLKIHGGPLRSIHYRPEVASAQVKTCVLFAGLFANGETVVDAVNSRSRLSALSSSAKGILPAFAGARRFPLSRPTSLAIFRARRSFFALRRSFRAPKSRCPEFS